MYFNPLNITVKNSHEVSKCDAVINNPVSNELAKYENN